MSQRGNKTKHGILFMNRGISQIWLCDNLINMIEITYFGKYFMYDLKLIQLLINIHT